jgi:hypothetical protein
MIKLIIISIGWVVGLLAGLAKILTYCNLPSETLFGKIAAIGEVNVSLPIAVIIGLAAMVVAYFWGRGLFKSHKTLAIHSATYGCEDKVIDVTAKLKSLVKNNSLTVLVGNHLGGDPLRGIGKHLEVWYSYGSSQRRTRVGEKKTLELP